MHRGMPVRGSDDYSHGLIGLHTVKSLLQFVIHQRHCLQGGMAVGC